MKLRGLRPAPDAPDRQRLTLLIEFDTYAKPSQLEAAAREVLRNIHYSINNRARVFKPVEYIHAKPNKNATVRYGSLWEEVLPESGA